MGLCGNFTEYFTVSSDFFDSVDLEISIFFRTDFYKWYHSQWNSEDKKCASARYRISRQQKKWRNFVWVNDFLLFLGAGYLLKFFSRCCKNWSMRVNCRTGKWTVHEIYNTWPQICLQCNSLHDDSMTISRVQWCLTCKYHRTISLSHGEAFSFHLWYSPNPSVRSQLLQHVFI